MNEDNCSICESRILCTHITKKQLYEADKERVSEPKTMEKDEINRQNENFILFPV